MSKSRRVPHPLRLARDQLVAATEAFHRMKGIGTDDHFSDFEREWEDFLVRLDKAWKRANLASQGLPRFSHWTSRYSKLRKTDPLLKYLHQARNSSEHALQTGVSGISVKIREPERSPKSPHFSRFGPKLENVDDTPRLLQW